jgi:flagellar secretion chaperone FliS
MYRDLVEASMERSIEKLDGVIQLLEYERETWQLLMQKLVEERAAGREPVAAAMAGLQDRAPLSIEG